MTYEAEQVINQLSINGTAWLKAPRKAGETAEQAVKRLHRRLAKYRKRRGLVAWRLNELDNGVLVTLKKV